MLFALWQGFLHRRTRDLDLLGFGDPAPESVTAVFKEIVTQSVPVDDGILFDAVTVEAAWHWLLFDRTGAVVGSHSPRYASRVFARSILARPSSVSKAAPRGPAFAERILSCVANPSRQVPLPPVRLSKSRTPTQTLNQPPASVDVHDFFPESLRN